MFYWNNELPIIAVCLTSIHIGNLVQYSRTESVTFSMQLLMFIRMFPYNMR